MRRLLVVELAAVATISVIAGLGFHRVFVGQSFLWPVAGAAGLAVIISTLTALRRTLAITTLVLVHILGFVVYVTVAALGSTSKSALPSLDTLRTLVGGLTGGWADLLSISLPAAAAPRLLVTACAVSWMGAALASEMAHRSRNAVAPVIPPVVAYSITLMLASGEPGSPLALPLTFCGVALLLMLVHVNRWTAIEPGGATVRVAAAAGTGPGSPTEVEPSIDISADRRILTGLPVIAIGIAAALAAAAIPAAAMRSSFDPRTLRSQDVEIQSRVSPLASVYRKLTEPSRPLFQMEIGRLSDSLQVPRVRVATLDRFDGATWSSSAEYASVGTVLPLQRSGDITLREVTQTYTIDELDGPWLPAADRPTRVQTPGDEVELGFDRNAGTLIAGTSDLAGLTYQITSQISVPTDAQLAAARPGSGEELTALTALPPGTPPIVADLAQEYAKDGANPYEQLKGVEKGLKDDFSYSESIDPGSSYGHISQFLNAGRRGYAEQFAGSFALMARSLGYPSRLSVGYLTGELGVDGPEGFGNGDITTRQAHVWPEVFFEGVGWVAFEPTPARVPASEPPPRSEAEIPTGTGGLVEEEPARAQVVEPQGEQGDGIGGPNGQIYMLLLLVALALSALLGLVAAKALLRRRRLRRAVTPAERVLGAWSNLTDRLLEVGVPLSRSMTAREVARSAESHIPSSAVERLARLAPMVTSAVFAPSQPAMDRVETFESETRDVISEVLMNRSAWQRLRAALSPRPLVYMLNARRLSASR